MKIYHILAAALIFPIFGCSDSDEWTPGPTDTESGVRAYFVKPSKTSYIFDTESSTEAAEVDVTVERLITDEGISIPLKLTSEADGISLSGNAEFKAGQNETTVTVNCEGIEVGKQVSFTLEIPDNQFYTYGIGLPSVKYTVIKSTWVEISEKVTYWYWDSSSEDIYPQTYGKLYQLEGTNQFKMTDFFGSGLDMDYECTSGDYTQFVPLNNCDFESAKGTSMEQYEFWYLYDDETDDWPEWTPGNVEGYPSIYYLGVYGSEGYCNITMIDDPTDLYGYLYMSSYLTYSNGEGYANLYATFYLNQNPFNK